MDEHHMLTCTKCNRLVTRRGGEYLHEDDGSPACEIVDGFAEMNHEPIPGHEVCDFCGGDGPFMVLVTQTASCVTIESDNFAQHHIDEDGMWAACEGCRVLIDAGRVREMSEHVLAKFSAEVVELVELPIKQLHREVVGGWDRIWRTPREMGVM